MKLKTGLTYWSAVDGSPLRLRLPPRQVNCDVAVIGAGITGALVAHRLAEAGLDVVVVDKRQPGTGSTSASTALLLYETDVSLSQLKRMHGWSSAVRAYRLGREAIREIGRTVRRLRVDGGFRPRKSLYLASDAAGLRLLQREYRDRRRAGLPVHVLTRAQLRARFGVDLPGAIYSPGSAEVDALKLAQSLFAYHVKRRSLRMFSGHVTAVEQRVDGVRLRLAGRRKIEARYVVVASGYEAAPFLESGLVALHSSYVIASQPQPRGSLWPEECLIWETARPYFYLRTTRDHRVLFGGEDEPFADPVRRDAKLAVKAQRLRRRFQRLFPRIPFEIEYAWTGTFAETRDGLPFIGARPGAPRVLFALGYGGNGITFSQIAAKLIAQMCQGRTPRDAAIFRFDR